MKNNLKVEIVKWIDGYVPLTMIREKVFIEEQKVTPQLEWDGMDEEAIHFLVYKDERLQVLTRYLRVLPENPLQYQKGTFEEPWYVNRHSSQIEALTFRCFRTVWLRGVSLANPLEQGKVVNVVSVLLYEGNKPLGRGNPCDCLNRELQGGGGIVLTDIYFSEGKKLQEMEVYTLKLKLLGTNPAEKIAIYHGNHIGRYEDGQSSDGTAWNCEPTAGVDIGEKNSGQHELLSPILRLIYSG